VDGSGGRSQVVAVARVHDVGGGGRGQDILGLDTGVAGAAVVRGVVTVVRVVRRGHGVVTTAHVVGWNMTQMSEMTR
jgi:hypothetical protein